MNKNIRIPSIILVALCALISKLCAKERLISYDEIVTKLVSLDQLSILPEVGERAGMGSTYNRDSRYDPETDSYIYWDRNYDALYFRSHLTEKPSRRTQSANCVRVEEGGYVFAEMEGPGVIWRIWSANAKAGDLRIYIDGEDEPVLDMPFENYFDSSKEPFNYPSLAYNVVPTIRHFDDRPDQFIGAGFNLYVPIPFSKSCKVVGSNSEGLWFVQVTYSHLPEGTDVESFTGAFSSEQQSALRRVDKLLATGIRNNPNLISYPDHQTIGDSFSIKGGESKSILDVSGTGAVLGLRIKVDRPEDIKRMLRELSISAYWDGDDSPSVWSPLGDFFGTAPGLNEYRTLPVGYYGGWFYANWFMPYENGAEIIISNDGSKDRTLQYEVIKTSNVPAIDQMGRFHAKWHRGAFPPKEVTRWNDWTLLTTEGRGRYVGSMLHVWNPMEGWWGEGDEKFFIDGEKFPSLFGTGTEDYFGYAWSSARTYNRPFHSTNFSIPPANHVTVNRFHFGDSVPFQTSFTGYLEKDFPKDSFLLHPSMGRDWIEERNASCKYAAIAYWYLDKEGVDPYLPVPLEDRVEYFDIDKVERSVPMAVNPYGDFD